MSESYPLYPRLAEEGVLEADAIIKSFKEKIAKAAADAIGELYVDLPDYIESDSWGNFRNSLLDGLTNYGNRKIQGYYDFAKIRRQIFVEFKSEIINDLNQELLKENRELKESLRKEREYAHRSME